MKLLISSSLIFLVTIVLGIGVNFKIDRQIQNFNQSLQEIQPLIVENEWLKAQEQAQTVQKKWEKTTQWWPLVLDHQELEEIDYLLSQVSEYIQKEDLTLAQSSLAELKERAEHIPEQEQPTLQNIF